MRGEALQILHSLELSDDNFDIALSLLKERYENKKVLIHNHMKNIFDMSSVSKESYKGLRNLIDVVQRNTRALKNLGECVEQWDTPLIFIVVSRLEIHTRKEWEAQTSHNLHPKLDELLTFLKNKCHLLETLDMKQTKPAEINHINLVKSCILM